MSIETKLLQKAGALTFISFQTVRFKNELERNITIKLGYANAKVSILFSVYNFFSNK